VVIPPIDSEGHSPRDIKFQPVPHATIPPDVAALQIEIERTLTTLIVLFPATGKRAQTNEIKFRIYFDKLAGIAIAGLGQDQPLLGSMALATLKDEIVTRESGRVKNAYIRRLGLWSASFTVIFVVLYLTAGPEHVPDWIAKKRGFFILILGSFIGTWLSFSIRKVALTFSDLSVAESDQLDPPIRLIFVAGLTLVIGLMFATELASITIGKFHTTFLTSGGAALVIGLFCGISEQSLSTTVGAKAGEFIGLLGQTTGNAGQGPPDGPAKKETGAEAQSGGGSQTVEASPPVAPSSPAPDKIVPADFHEAAAKVISSDNS
jgi:hypothetical protein